jgi:Raf kinase inhibitor-like YbhB/YbcL family protein
MLKKVLCISLLASASWWAHAADFTLTSASIEPEGTLTHDQVFDGFGCTGKNISPSLAWKNPPKGTKSYAITVYDPDAPTGSGWWHWVVYNLPSSTVELPAGAGTQDGKGLPDGARQGRTDFGVNAFGGACPPEGHKAHRYIFTVHALSTEALDVPSDATAALIGYQINANSLGKASFTAYYGR